jgi:hypothetical protein
MLIEPAVQMEDMTQSVGITQLLRRGECRVAARYRLVYFAPPQQDQRDKIQRGDPVVRRRQEYGGSAIGLIAKRERPLEVRECELLVATMELTCR